MPKPHRSATISAFEKALKALEQHDRPDGYLGLTASNRRKASFQQFEVFASTYWPMWRFIKIRMYRRLFTQRDEIASDIERDLPDKTVSPSSRAYHEVTNGLMASVVSEFCQYAEDLAILCRALQGRDGYFARDLRKYAAGKIQDIVKSWAQFDRSRTCHMLIVPMVQEDIGWSDPKIYDHYKAGIDEAVESLKSISAAYSAWFYHFICYKHGLALALAPFASQIDEETIARRRTNTEAFPMAFDSGSLPEIINDPRFQQLLVIPNMQALDVRLNAFALSKERNLLRYVNPPLGPMSPNALEDIERAAYAVGQLQIIALQNYIWNRRPGSEESSEWAAFLPQDNKFCTIMSENFSK